LPDFHGLGAFTRLKSGVAGFKQFTRRPILDERAALAASTGRVLALGFLGTHGLWHVVIRQQGEGERTNAHSQEWERKPW
jgi:hypothetical protein